MFKTALFLLCSVAILVSGADNAAPDSSVTSTVPSTNSSGSSTTPFSSTTPTTPITSSSQIPTTTSGSTTTGTSTPSTSTTSAPAPAPTPNPTPKPIPTPETGKWLVNETSQTCIIVQMALQFSIKYTTKENKTAYQVFNLPGTNKTSANGKCGTTKDLEQNITLTWIAANTTAMQNTLMLHFVKNITTNQYALHHLELNLAPQELPQIRTNTSTIFEHVSDQFKTGINNSYRCLRQQTLSLNATADAKATGNITVSNLQFQAFHEESSTSFGFAEDCAFDTPDIVPIAVGCALALLVVIVLIAYLVGRRRSQARGYLSM